MIHRTLQMLGLAGALAFVAACGPSTPSMTGAADAVPQLPAEGSTALAPAGRPSPDAADIRVDMNAIFPQGPGRDLVLDNCQNCHTFVPIVILQMEEHEWTRSSVNHRDRVAALTDEEFQALYTYLKANFNPTRAVPTLPKALLESWTTY